jgi:hypothetical protein
VEPPTWLVALTFVLTLLVSIGTATFAVMNEFDGDRFADVSTDGIRANLMTGMQNLKAKIYLLKLKMRLRR